MRTARLAGLLVMMTVLACGPTPGDAETGTDASTATGETTGAPTSVADDSGPGPTTSGEPTSTGEVTTDSPPSSGSTTGGEPDTTTAPDTDSSTGASVCGEPDADEVIATWTLTVGGKPLSQSVTAPCTVSSSELAGTMWTVGLDCELDGNPTTIELVVTRTPEGPAELFPGDELILEHHWQEVFWINEWFALHIASNPFLVPVSGIRADHVVPNGVTAQELFGVEISTVDVCEPTPGGPCGEEVRLALDMAWSSAQKQIFDGQQGWLSDLGGTVSVWVAQATRQGDFMRCDDVPEAWFDVVMAGNFGP